MKRIALLLAAVGLASGCVVETNGNRGDAIIYWSYWNSDLLGDFGSLSATSTELCAAAGVDEIEITLTDPAGDVGAPSTGGCVTGNDVPGARFVDLEAGTWDYYIAGYRGGVLVFEYWDWFEVWDGDETLVDSNMTAIYYDLRINYSAETCVAGDTIEFDLYRSGDLLNPVYSTYGGPNPPVAVPCSTTTASMVIPSMPDDAYAFGEWIQFDTGGFEVGWSSCSPTWTQSAFSNKTVTVSLVDPEPAFAYCPQ